MNAFVLFYDIIVGYLYSEITGKNGTWVSYPLKSNNHALLTDYN